MRKTNVPSSAAGDRELFLLGPLGPCYTPTSGDSIAS